MATPWGLMCLFMGLIILGISNAHPMEQLLSGSEGPNGQVMGVLVGVMVSVCLVFVLLACVCCKRRSGFKVFRNSPVSASVINETSLTGDDPGHVNPIANAEFTIFTPLSPPHHNNNVFRSQPPVICYTENEAAPVLNKAVNSQINGIDVSDWFADTEYDFPRSRLKYIRELGTGWFGRIVEGEAHGIDTNTLNSSTWTPVAVRILESSASAHEQAQFLHEASIYRTGAHSNILQLLGRSLEASPLLLIHEFCPKGDLKKFLLENKECKDSEMMVVVPLRYCVQLASAVQFLHEHNLPHLDLAARTCQISSDLSLKLGDYGLAVTQYPNDYYQGTPSIPVRWCAPESVNHTNTTLQPKQVTLEANIWSLAVTFWEICEWGRMPYDWLTDDEVISQVMDQPHTRLPQPTLNSYYIQPLYRLMEYCWSPCADRPQINQIYSMLIHLSKIYTSSPTTQHQSNEFSMENFDSRWESFKPNTIIKTDNTRTKSASLTNLHGSFENLTNEVNDTVIQMDSWLENVATHTGDMQYVRGLSEAIHELDTALASEQTSSSSSFEPTPNSSLGPARSDTIIHIDDSSYLDSLIFPKRSESGSETEDETWRRRIERGAYSEKVKQKSKSVADLMVLTHIDMNTVRDIFQEEIKKLQEERRESLLFVPVQNTVQNEQLNANTENKYELPINQEIIDPLQSFEPTDNQSVTEYEVSSDNLPKSTIQESNLVIEPDSKLDEKLINESNQNTNQDSYSFDTFLQNKPFINNKIDIESTESLLIPDHGNKNVVINENQNILSNESKISTDDVQEENEKCLEHIEPVKMKIQDFINNEKGGVENIQIVNELSTIDNSAKNNSQILNINVVTESEEVKPEIMQNIPIFEIPQEDKIVQDIFTLKSSEAIIETTVDPIESEKLNDVEKEIANQIVDDTIETAILTIIENKLKDEKTELQIQNNPENNILDDNIKRETQDFILNELSSSIFDQHIVNAEIENHSLSENIELAQDIYEDLLKNVDANVLNISPPPEFIEDFEMLEENLNIPLTDTNILVQFDMPIKEKSEIKEQENTELSDHNNIQKPLEVKQDTELITEIFNLTTTEEFEKEINLPKIETEPVKNEVMPDIIETIKEQEQILVDIEEDLLKSEEVKLPVDPIIIIKSSEFSEIQNFINNERNNNQDNIIPIDNKTQIDTEENSNVVATDLTSELIDTSNVQQINQVFNVFNVTVDHKPPLECFTSPVKNYYARPFDQNEIIADINSLLESEHKYESKNSVCTSNLQNDFLPFVNGINGELSNKIIDILNEKGDGPKIIELENNLESIKCEESIIRHEKPKKLSELVLDSLKTNSISEDSGFASVQCEEKVLNGTKDSSSEDLLKISVDSLEEILSNSEENLHDCDIIEDFDKTAYEQPKRLSEIALENLNNYSTSPDELVTSFVDDEIKEIKHKPKKLAELVQDTLNKTYVENENGIQNLPDIVLDNLQNKTFVKDQNESILINVINDSPMKSLNSLSDKFEENSESAIEEMCTESDKKSEIILDSLPCNSPVTSESTDNVSDKTVIEIKVSDNYTDICDEIEKEGILESPNYIPTSTPFKSNIMPKKTDINNESFFSFVSEGDEPSDCQTRVILGPCEEYGLGLYSGLKTTFGKFSDDDRPEEEILQFSSNFMPFTEANTTHNTVDYSLETWDKFLGKSLQDQDNCENSVFANFSPKQDNKNEDLNKTVLLTNNKNETFTIENEVPAPDTQKEEESSQIESTQNSWEPGEGWFLHPQTCGDELTGQIDTSSSENIDNSYVGFALDEECVNALRNELAAKLPHAQGISHEEPQEPEDWDAEERNEIIVKYNVYATPLSPIPEESCCDDVYCDQIQHRDGSDSESDWSEPGLGQTSQLEEDILVVDTETHTALILESPSLREPQHRHTPSQDSCCSNDTLFNLEDLNYGHSPQHHTASSSGQTELDSDPILEIEITENETPKQSPMKIPKIEEELNSDSTEMNLTYTKPDINIDETENTNQQIIVQDSQTETESKSDEQPKNLNKLELKLDPNVFGIAPLPSPEDIPWRQLPASLLTYNEVVQNDKYEIQDSEDGPIDVIENVIDQEDLILPQDNTNDDLSDSVRDCTLDTDLYSNLTDIRFSGPCDTQLMSTSFSESADYNEERDWDSGSDTRSSSSGEFIWKEGEHEESLRALHAASHDVGVTDDLNPMDAIEEENSNSSEDSDDCEDIEETEFVPSAWDAQATPTKSALRSPEKSNKRKNQQKGVWFKKQKYHCVYEYPREPESPVAPDLWRPLSDLSSFADWELDPDSCVPAPFDDTDANFDVLDKFVTRSTYPLTSGNVKQRDLYQLNPFPDFPTGLSASDEDFFISSSARPFQTIVQSSQFFPGQPNKSKFMWQDYQSSSQQSSRDLSEGITPDSGIDDVTPASVSEPGPLDMLPSINHKVPPLKCLAAIAANKTPPTEQKNVDSSLGGLRHTRNRLKLDLPPSPNSFSSTRTFSIDVSSNDPVINREIPTFTTFGKSRFSVQHVATPTDESSDPLQPGFPKVKNVSFEALPHKPMKLTEKVYIMDKSEEEGKHKPVEMVQGEASLLDSADEDSGIESSANATLERHQQQVLE